MYIQVNLHTCTLCAHIVQGIRVSVSTLFLGDQLFQDTGILAWTPLFHLKGSASFVLT